MGSASSLVEMTNCLLSPSLATAAKGSLSGWSARKKNYLSKAAEMKRLLARSAKMKMIPVWSAKRMMDLSRIAKMKSLPSEPVALALRMQASRARLLTLASMAQSLQTAYREGIHVLEASLPELVPRSRALHQQVGGAREYLPSQC